MAADKIADPDGAQLRITVPVVMPRCGGRIASEKPSAHYATRLDYTLTKALRTAHHLITRDRFGHPATNLPLTKYQRRLVRLAFLALDSRRRS